MIKHKKLNRFLCLLLAVVVLFAMPLNTQAHAAVAAPWVMYAIITGLAAMGVTFTCAGGVGAMISAMEEKVAEYQTQTGIQLPIIIIENTSIQPPSEPPSGWNQNKGYFFLTYAGAMALTAFADWLVNDGGWGEGEHNYSNQVATYEYMINGNEYVGYSSIVEDGNITQMGTVFKGNLDNIESSEYIFDSNSVLFKGENGFTNYLLWYKSNGGRGDDIYHSYISGGKLQSSRSIISSKLSGTGYTKDDIAGITTEYLNNWLYYGVVMNDGFYRRISYLYADKVVLSEEASVIVPVEMPTFTLEQTEGILIDTGATGAETLEELGELFETLFTDTGTIPQPQPQVITDPATQPAPTPVPTPNPSPEYEDVESLGLPALGDALMDKFPFCLPEDLGRLLNIFTAERQTPKWEVDLYEPLHGRVPMQGDTTLSIDLAEYEEIGQITRWASVIGFCLFLLVVTKEFITW